MTFADIEQTLRKHGLRKTKPRVELGQIIFSKHPTHWTADSLHQQSLQSEKTFSLATVYNTLNQFADKGILRRIQLQGNLCYYDTNLSQHHHVYHTISKRLEDIPTDSITAQIPWTGLQSEDTPQFDIIVHAHD